MTKTSKRRFNRLAWFKQLFPRTLYSLYRTDSGEREFAIWRQWLGRVYDYRRFSISA